MIAIHARLQRTGLGCIMIERPLIALLLPVQIVLEKCRSQFDVSLSPWQVCRLERKWNRQMSLRDIAVQEDSVYMSV
jgi:hypothetical protein